MDKQKKEALAQILTNGLPKTQANKLAGFIVEFYESINTTKIVQVPRQVGKTASKLTGEEKQLAETLSIKVNHFIDSTGYKYKKPELLELANAISMLHRLDKKPYKEIASLISYLYDYYQPNSSFDWRMQVRSGMAFRRHYEKIMVSASQDYAYIKSRQIEDV